MISMDSESMASPGNRDVSGQSHDVDDDVGAQQVVILAPPGLVRVVEGKRPRVRATRARPMPRKRQKKSLGVPFHELCWVAGGEDQLGQFLDPIKKRPLRSAHWTTPRARWYGWRSGSRDVPAYIALAVYKDAMEKLKKSTLGGDLPPEIRALVEALVKLFMEKGPNSREWATIQALLEVALRDEK